MRRGLVGLLLLLLILVIVYGGAYAVAGSGAPPQLTIVKPEGVVGQAGSLDVTAAAPNARFVKVIVTVEQNGRSTVLYALNGAQTATLSHVDDNTLRITRPLGKQTVPELQSGAARIVVTATRPPFLSAITARLLLSGLAPKANLESTATKDIEVRLEPPRLAVLSTHHYVNHGGAEMVVYRATPADVASGVRVGDVEYPGFPASGAGAANADAALKVAFFALLPDQPLKTPIVAFARDGAGNEATASFVDNVFPKTFKKSRIPLDDTFINRVVPEILEHSPELKMAAPAAGSAEMLAAFLRINGELRRLNADHIAAMAGKTSLKRLWKEPFVQLGNSQVEAGFADRRTYVYNGKDVDQQVHLGFDLAVTAHVPVLAANDGVVLNASWLGIYGNCVVIDHGLGVQSLYGHLQSFDVKVGDTVARGQQIGLSDSTGLAGGDHLHFTMLVGGRMVNPVEWWDAHWIADRVERKLAEAR